MSYFSKRRTYLTGKFAESKGIVMLRVGGYLNILIAIGHLAGLIWADAFFEATGIAKEMKEMELIHPSFPYLITVLVTVFFLIFGLYGLS